MLSRYNTMNLSTEHIINYSLIIIRLPFKANSSILMGKGSDPETNVRETLTISLNGMKYFVIPSSSIKGVFRKLSYAIAYNMRNRFGEKIRIAIESHDEDSKMLVHRVPNDLVEQVDQIYKDNKKWFDEICYSIDRVLCKEIRRDDYSRFVDIILSMYCPICGLYGSRFYAGIVTFKSIVKPYRTDLVDMRTHVVIDRNTRTKKTVGKRGLLYTDNLLYVGNEDLILEIFIKDLQLGSPAALVFASTLEYIGKGGLLLGGGKSIGYGALELEARNVEWAYRDYSSLREYLKPRRGTGLESLIDLLRAVRSRQTTSRDP